MKNKQIILILMVVIIHILAINFVTAENSTNITDLQNRVAILEQKVAVLQDNLFDDASGNGSISIGVEFLDNDGCPIYLTPLTNKPKDLFKKIFQQECKNDVENSRIKNQLNSLNITNYDNQISGLESNQSNLNQRLSALESWKQTISDTITSILNLLTGHTTKIDNYETRISYLENKTPIITNGTLPNYFKYLSSGERKAMVCGYAQDSHLTHIEDLGWKCDVTYKTIRGKETASCKCK